MDKKNLKILFELGKNSDVLSENRQKTKSVKTARERSDRKYKKIIENYCDIHCAKTAVKIIRAREKHLNHIDNINNSSIERNTKEFYLDMTKKLLTLIEYIDITIDFDWIKYYQEIYEDDDYPSVSNGE